MWFFHFVLTPILPFSSSFFLFSSSNLRTPSFLLILSFSLYFFLIFRLFYSLLPFSILLSRTSLLLVLFLLSPSIFPLSLSLSLLSIYPRFFFSLSPSTSIAKNSVKKVGYVVLASFLARIYLALL